MDLRRLRKGEWIAAVAGIGLLAVLPLKWYDLEIPPGQGIEGIPDDLSMSAWQVLSVLDVLMAASALLAIGLLIVVASARSPSPGIAGQTLGFLFCAAVGIAMVLRLAVLPGDLRAVGFQVDSSRLPVAYLGTLLAVTIPVGLLVAMRDERLSRGDQLTDATGVPVDSAPVPEDLPAPRP